MLLFPGEESDVTNSFVGGTLISDGIMNGTYSSINWAGNVFNFIASNIVEIGKQPWKRERLQFELQGGSNLPKQFRVPHFGGLNLFVVTRRVLRSPVATFANDFYGFELRQV